MHKGEHRLLAAREDALPALRPGGDRARGAGALARRLGLSGKRRKREMALMIEDVTGRKEAAEELEKSEERFRRMVQTASNVITVLGADGEIRYQSPAIERVLGYAVEDLVGENVFDCVHPEDVERARGALGRISRSGGVSGVIGYRFLHEDGSWRNLEAIGSVPEGDLVEGVVVNSRDVTERVRVEEDLKLKNRAIDAASNGILITGTPEDDLPIVYYNPALERITGYSEDEVLGHNARFLQGSDKDQVEAYRLRPALEGGKEWSGVLRNYTIKTVPCSGTRCMWRPCATSSTDGSRITLGSRTTSPNARPSKRGSPTRPSTTPSPGCPTGRSSSTA